MDNFNYECDTLMPPKGIETSPKVVCEVDNAHFECSFLVDLTEAVMTVSEFEKIAQGMGKIGLH